MRVDRPEVLEGIARRWAPPTRCVVDAACIRHERASFLGIRRQNQLGGRPTRRHGPGGSARWDAGPVVLVSDARLEELVAEAIDGLPAELGRAMDNVSVFVEDRSRRGNLLGLYEGIPLTPRHSGYSGMVMPDRITIFRQTICASCDTEDEVVRQVRRTVVHVVAHHFGIDDARLAELGSD